MKPRLLVISAILPFPLNSGQRVRVYNKLLALRELFHITFLGVAPRPGLTRPAPNWPNWWMSRFCCPPAPGSTWLPVPGTGPAAICGRSAAGCGPPTTSLATWS